MFRTLALLLACGCAVVCQPPDGAPCAHEDQCEVGFFCDVHVCRECLRCEDLKREPMSATVAQTCTKSVADCGPCLAGLVEDPSGNVNAQCVLASSVNAPGVPTYVWFILAMVLMSIIIGVIVVYVLRNPGTLKILATTRASLGTPTQYRNTVGVESGAPPPYNSAVPHYSPVRPTSPPLEGAPYASATSPPQAVFTDEVSESERPFIDCKGAVNGGYGGARQRDSNQEAMPFNHMRVRFPEQPPSYASALTGGGGGEESNSHLNEEETMPSAWTPAADTDTPSNNNASGNGAAVNAPGSAAELSTLLSEARYTTVIRPPPSDQRAEQSDDATPSKVLCVRQEPNNNTIGVETAGEGSLNRPAPLHAPRALDIKIFVQQHNDVRVLNT